MRVGFPRHRIGAGAIRCPATRESGNGKVKASPEEMHWAGFSYKSCSELVENRVYRKQDPPELLGGFRVVRGVQPILVKGNWIGNFDRHPPDFHLNLFETKHLHEVLVEIGHRARCEGESFLCPLACLKHKLMSYEVE